MARGLTEYRRKRDFKRTSEPAGLEPAPEGSRFVVHKHSATADHYDLRLQVGDVLKCWAVPRGPSLNPDDKRLAVQTEDHPVDYADFEGVIPKGQYGAGPMIVWDAGTWAPMDDIEKSLAKGQFKFRLVGEKLRGGWMLTRLKPRPGERQTNWLLFKERDPAADRDTDILEARPESVRSGRTIEDLAIPPRRAAPALLRPGAVKGAVRGPFPERIEPQLASNVDMPPEGEDWLHEIKFDGYRTLAHIRNGTTVLRTRSGLDWTGRYGELKDAFDALDCRDAVLDGEIVVLDAKGVSDFAALQQALSDGASGALVYFAFDCLYLNGWDLRKVPLAKRKALLEKLLAGKTGERSAIQYCDHIAGKGEAFFHRVSEMGLEGVVSKRADGPYLSGRGKGWLKAKALRRGVFVIAGYTQSEAAGGLASLALGEWVDDELVYRGKVGTGFDAATAARLLERLKGLEAGVDRPPDMPGGVTAVRPVLSARIVYTSRTRSGALRHPVFDGLREVRMSGDGAQDRKRLITDGDLATIWVTNPTRRLFGRSGPSKLDIAVYYAQVGDFMLPHLLGRPVSLIRCPSGRLEDCFYQRHAFAGMPDSVSTFDSVDSDGEKQTYLSIDHARGYLALAQFGVIEFHSWGSRTARLEKPDRVIFDLDPGEGVPWREIVEAAVHVRGELEKLDLVPFVKTTGGKGIHVVVPLVPRLEWKQIHRATGEIAEGIAATAPETFVTTMAKKQRRKRIFIDFHRNSRGATAAAPYTLRAGVKLPVSTPLSWHDLESVDAPADLNYSVVPGLLAASGDPWAEIEKSARLLPKATKARQ